LKLGGFGKIADYDKIRHAGYDYAELDMPEIEALSEEALDQFVQHIQDCGFPVQVGSRILPVTEPIIFRPGFSAKKLESYVRSSCRKNRKVGISKILFGNGKARWLTDDESLQREQQFVDFMKMLCEAAGENSQTVLIEPLGPKYSNYLNTVPEVLEAVEKIHMLNLSVMADLRHFVWSGESFEDIEKYHERIGHYHIDFPLSWPERNYPSVDDGYNYQAFLNRVKQADNPELTMTIEADIPEDWDQAFREADALLGKYWR